MVRVLQVLTPRIFTLFPGSYVACLTIATSGGCTSSKCDTLVFPGMLPCNVVGFSASWTLCSNRASYHQFPCSCAS